MPTTIGMQSGEPFENLIKRVFYFIYLVDESHFKGMCRALEFSDSDMCGYFRMAFVSVTVIREFFRKAAKCKLI